MIHTRHIIPLTLSVSSSNNFDLASLIFLAVSSRMKQRVCPNDPSLLYATFESISKCTSFPSFVRNRTGTSAMAFPLPSCLKISNTSSFSSGQKFMIGWPMYSSAVYPNTLSSVWFAQRTVPSPFSQCMAIGAFWKKSISSASRALYYI